MRRWELWKSPDGTETSYFAEDDRHARDEARSSGLVYAWSTMAKSYNDAMRARNRYLGFEEYQPMVRPDGTPYPEDEGDDEADRDRH